MNAYRYLQLRDGATLYVENHNPQSDISVLFVHGGPGESCISFSYFSTLLSERYNVIAVDQRGVMRSKEELRTKLITIDQIIDDFEEVRMKLNINKWYILGHSFGGYIAMRYAIKYPDSILGIIYENPCFNIQSSLLHILSKYREYYLKIDDPEKSYIIDGLIRDKSIVRQLDGIISLPELDRKRIFKSEAITAQCKKCYDENLITPEAIKNCLAHYDVIKQDETLNYDFFKLIDDMNMPALLLQGEYDPMLPIADRMFFLQNDKNDLVVVMKSGHYIHSDAPEKMKQIVAEYIERKEEERENA